MCGCGKGAAFILCFAYCKTRARKGLGTRLLKIVHYELSQSLMSMGLAIMTCILCKSWQVWATGHLNYYNIMNTSRGVQEIICYTVMTKLHHRGCTLTDRSIFLLSSSDSCLSTLASKQDFSRIASNWLQSKHLHRDFSTSPYQCHDVTVTLIDDDRAATHIWLQDSPASFLLEYNTYHPMLQLPVGV